jgi:leucyl aminopeptidase (aminopeptidase T)
MAFGSGFDFSRDPGAERPNTSRIHVDVMIGRPELEVRGRDARGRDVAVLVGGALLP